MADMLCVTHRSTRLSGALFNFPNRFINTWVIVLLCKFVSEVCAHACVCVHAHFSLALYFILFYVSGDENTQDLVYNNLS